MRCFTVRETADELIAGSRRANVFAWLPGRDIMSEPIVRFSDGKECAGAVVVIQRIAPQKLDAAGARVVNREIKIVPEGACAIRTESHGNWIIVAGNQDLWVLCPGRHVGVPERILRLRLCPGER